MTVHGSLLAGVGLLMLVAISGKAWSAEPVPVSLDDRAIATAFFIDAYQQGTIDPAFDTFVGRSYVDHDGAGRLNRAGAIARLKAFRAEHPKVAIWMIDVRSEGGTIAIYNHAIADPGEHGEAVVDTFRIDHGKIVEHWRRSRPVAVDADRAHLFPAP